MNILFLTMGSFESIDAHSMYSDLLRCFCNHSHNVYVIAPSKNGSTTLTDKASSHVLQIRIGDVTGTNKNNLSSVANKLIDKFGDAASWFVSRDTPKRLSLIHI